MAAITLAVAGAGEAGTDAALKVTGRLSFLLFWPAYAGSAMAALFGARFALMRRHGRDFGLAFAAAQLVHVGLIGWLCFIGAAPSAGVFVVFGAALVWIYALALVSLGAVQRLLAPRAWWLLRIVGMNYIMYAFAVDFLADPLGGTAKHVAFYAPFAVLTLAGPALRLAAFAARLGQTRQRRFAQ